MSIWKADFSDGAYQINDGLHETASCGNAVAYDSRHGLVFAEHMTGDPCMYGEASGKVCLSVFPPRQPWNARFVLIDGGTGGSRGLLCNAIYMVGDARVRLIFETDRGDDPQTWTRDYDFLSDTVTERRTVWLRTEQGRLRLNNASYLDYIRAHGYDTDCKASTIVNKVSRFGEKLYTAITLDGLSYPILATIEDNEIVPFMIVPVLNAYEFRYYMDDTGIYGVFRYPVDDSKPGRCGTVISRDGGKTWETHVFEDGIQSRPDILPYQGKPLVIYNYLSRESDENFPPMHHHRNAIRMIYDGKEIFDVFSKYGIVEHETVDIHGDLYMAFSNSEQALMDANNACWNERGLKVENGKEKSNWMKLGYLL